MAGMQKQPGKHNDKPTATIAASFQYRQALDIARINERTARRWQELAAIRRKTF